MNDMNNYCSFRVGKKSAQRLLDASPFEPTIRPRPLPRAGWEKPIMDVHSRGAQYQVRLANFGGHYVLRCPSLAFLHWPQELRDLVLSLRPRPKPLWTGLVIEDSEEENV